MEVRAVRPEDSRSGSTGLEAYALVKRYGAVTVLDRVSLTLRAGEILAVVGESGSGKSTLARLLLALETPTAGSVELDGAPLMRKTRADRRLLARTLGFVQQDAKSALDPHQSVGRAIAEPLVHLSWPRQRIHLRVRELAQELGLSEALLTQKTPTLSGGQQKRVCIARALAPAPRFLVCDEATSGLDGESQMHLLHFLAELRQTKGLGILFITHDIAAAAGLADHLAVMRAGRIVEQHSWRGSAADFCDPYSRALFSAAHLL